MTVTARRRRDACDQEDRRDHGPERQRGERGSEQHLHRARHLADSKRIRELNSPLIQLLGEVLERGRREGLFRGGVDPVQLYISIAGLAYFYLSNNHTLSPVFGRDLASPRALAQRLSHITEVVMGYLLRE